MEAITTIIMTTDANVIPIKAILFDLDGTLLDTEQLSDMAMVLAFGEDLLPAAVWKAYQESPQSYRLPWELKKQLLGLRGSDWAPIVIQYAHEHWSVPMTSSNDGEENSPVPVMTVTGLWSAWEKALNALCPQVEQCPGALALVESLAKSGIPMAIATSSRREAVQKKRTNHEAMFRHIPTIVTGDEVANGKPAPDIYLLAAKRLNIDNPEECLVFEDALSGVQAGAAAGCRVVAIPDPRFDADERKAFVETADVVLESLWEFQGARWGLPEVDLPSLRRTQER